MNDDRADLLGMILVVVVYGQFGLFLIVWAWALVQGILASR